MLHINADFRGLHHCHRCWLQQASNICTDHRLLSPLMCECNTKNEERLSEGDAHLSSLYDCRSFAADQVSVCLRSVPQDVKYAPICYPTLALDSLSELHWLWFGCSGIFWCFISFPRISPHLREKKSALAFIKDQFWFVWTLPSKGYAGVFGLGTAQVLYNQNFWHIFSNWHKFELRSHKDLCWAGFFVLADVRVGTVDWLNSGTTEMNAEFWIVMFLLKE